ncbi:MAG: hypothetical protein MK081_08255 [Flavobacteriales bacterium]|uniref:hypothetical protein n=1 Tax=Sanyastnella coralliicola TaxID=3069118 RepID=UPI0027B91C31|nr:hypothetical protein [Longitalea sp. SCSIO 12813]MCH2198763.1 hypothetical protein [Flavobacteriales bacterium]
MWKLPLIALLMLITCASGHHREEYDEALAERVPAIQLMPNWNDPITFGIATIYEGEVIDLDHVTMENFIMIYAGARKHIANKTGSNLFSKRGINNCYVDYVSAERQHYRTCDPVEGLWKLRYQKNPNDDTDKGGWSSIESAPDDRQLSMLRAFNITRLNDFAIGEDAWALIQAVNDPSWVAKYK